MQSKLALIGGEEFSDGFDEVHADLYASLGDGQHSVVFLPTCAADDGDNVVGYWCEQARLRFSRLGASVETPRVVDLESADEQHNARLIEDADWIYFGGGFPEVGMKILAGTRCEEAVQRAIKRGALVSGASGGAMLMGSLSWETTSEIKEALGRYWDKGIPEDWAAPWSPIIECLGLVPDTVLWPHYDRTFTVNWFKRLDIPEGIHVVGIDELTALVKNSNGWRVLGCGNVTIVDKDLSVRSFTPGNQVIF